METEAKKNAFDISALDAMESAEMTVYANGGPTGWTWTFAGPSHQNTIAQRSRIAKEELHERRLKEQAQVNNKKWKAPEEDPETVIKHNIEYVLERLLGWSYVEMNGVEYPFSRENAYALLSDKRKPMLLVQALEFLLEDASFMDRSAKN